jgi:hypothetical protein
MNRAMLFIAFAQRSLEAFISKQHSSELSKTENEARPVLIHFRVMQQIVLKMRKGMFT